jgi:hypothetical protein
MALYRLGKMEEMVSAGSQASIQKRVEAPYPTSMVTEQANIALAVRSVVEGSRA